MADQPNDGIVTPSTATPPAQLPSAPSSAQTSAQTDYTLAHDAATQMRFMLQGTKEMANQPGVVWSLMQANAHPADAGAIDQFLQELQLEKMVDLSRKTGAPITLNPDQRDLLDQFGVPYADVLHSSQLTYAQRAGMYLRHQSGGRLTAKTNQDGTLALGDQGQIQAVPTAKYLAEQHAAEAGPGGIAGFFDTIGRYVWHDTLYQAVKGVTEFGNAVQGGLVKNFEQMPATFAELSQPMAYNGNSFQVRTPTDTQAQDMRAQGYDPSNPLSYLAYLASGKAHTDLSDLDARYGIDQVNKALQFLKDPNAYQQAILGDSANYVTVDQYGHMALKPGPAGRLKQLESPQFVNLVRTVQSRDASVGNVLANTLNIDPVNHPDLYAAVSVPTNLAASFALDPTLGVLNGLKALKVAQVAIDGLGDADGIASILTKASHLPLVNSVQRGWKLGLQLGAKYRDAIAAGDSIKAAAAYGQFRAALPKLEPLWEHFAGGDKVFVGNYDTVLEGGKLVAKPRLEQFAGWQNIDEAAQWMKSNGGLTRLMGGKAAIESSYMPGAVSRFGYRALRGNVASWATARSAARDLTNYTKVEFGAYSNSELAAKLLEKGYIRPVDTLDEKTLLRTQATPEDAIDAHSGGLLAYPPASSAGKALGELMGLMREGLPAVSEHAALQDELDNLESELQTLMDKPSSQQDLEKIASLHDAIDTGRQLVQDAEKGLLATGTQIAKAQKALYEAESNAEQAAKDAAQAEAADVPTKYEITQLGKGYVNRNLRRYGSALGKDDPARFGLFSGPAIAARARLAATRFSELLPRNTIFDVNDPTTGNKVYLMARTYLSKAEAATFRQAWASGDNAIRKTLMDGLREQIAEAAGLGKTKAGRQLLADWKTEIEHYSVDGNELTIDGKPVAVTQGQTVQAWRLPDFRTIHMASARLGLWEASFGHVLTSKWAEYFMNPWKVLLLGKPSTFTRNALEGWLRTALEGKLGPAIQARSLAMTRNEDLWRLGYETEPLKDYRILREEIDRVSADLKGGGWTADERRAMTQQLAEANRKLENAKRAPIVQHEMALAEGNIKKAKAIRLGNRLSGDVLGRSGPANFAANLVPMVMLGRFYHAVLRTHLPEDDLRYLLTLDAQDLRESAEGFGQQAFASEFGYQKAAQTAQQITHDGYGAAHLRYAMARMRARLGKGIDPYEKIPEGEGAKWEETSTTGAHGLTAYANALHMRVDGMPETSKAIISHLGGGDIEDVIAALRKEAPDTGFGRTAFDDPYAAAPKGRKAVTPEEAKAGEEVWAKYLVKQYEHLLTGRNGRFQYDLAQYIFEHGKAPDESWIADHLTGDNRPESIFAPLPTAMPQGGVKGIYTALMDTSGAGFQWMVERELQRTTSLPIFLANYVAARKDFEPEVQRMLDMGIEPEAVENMAKELGQRSSWVRTEQMIDDPGQRTQFDIIARNMFPFSRAMLAMMRRWGGGLWRHPENARKMMLAYEGAVHSGLIYTNEYGEPTFTYPVSGVYNMLMRDVISKIPAFKDWYNYPIASDMTGSVLMSVPGADNPLRMSMGPMLTIPLRELYTTLLPGSVIPDAQAIDQAINGPIGVGQTWSQLLPTALRRFLDAAHPNETNGIVASSAMGAIALLSAGGYAPKQDASADVQQQFIERVQTQTLNQIYARWALGLFAPAAPSTPTDTAPGTQADFAWAIEGAKDFSDEFVRILNQTGGNTSEALAAWTALHPDEVIWKNGKNVKNKLYSAVAEPKTQSLSGTYLPATEESLKWMLDNEQFIKTHANVAGYFLPAQAFKGPFDYAAYQVQLQLGMREYKTPDVFRNQIYQRQAESIYYPGVQMFDNQIAAAHAEGNQALADQLERQRHDWETTFKAKNPIFGAKAVDYEQRRQTARDQLSTLRHMVATNTVPDGLGPDLSLMIQAWDRYTAYAGNLGTTNADEAAKANALAITNDWAQQRFAGTTLAGIWDGIFRELTPTLADLPQPQGVS